MTDEFNRPNKSPNPDGRFTLFPGKDKPTTVTLTADCKGAIEAQAVEARRRTGKAISRSDVVEAAHTIAGDQVVDWIVQKVEQIDVQAKAAAGGGDSA
jgi:hypothetical protein